MLSYCPLSNNSSFSYINDVFDLSTSNNLPTHPTCSLIKNHFDKTDVENNNNLFSDKSFLQTKQVLSRDKDETCNLKSSINTTGSLDDTKKDIHNYINQLNNLNDNSIFLLLFILIGIGYLIVFNKFFNYKQ